MGISSISSTRSGLSTYGSNGMGGLMSGLDVDEIVKGMCIGTTGKIAKQRQSKQLLSWQSDAYRSISSKLIEFSQKYTSYSSSTNMHATSFFAKNSITSMGGNSKYMSVSGKSNSADTLNILAVKQLARDKTQSLAGGAKGDLTTGEFDLSNDTVEVNNLAGKTIKVSYGGTPVEIKLAEGDIMVDGAKVELKYDTMENALTSINAILKNNSTIQGDVQLSQADGKISIKYADPTDATNKAFKIESGEDKSLAVLGLQKDNGINMDSEVGKVFNSATKTGDIITKTSSFEVNNLLGQTLTVRYNNKDYNITFGEEIIGDDGNPIKDDAGNPIKLKYDTVGNAIDSINTILSKDPSLGDLQGKVKLSKTKDDKLTMEYTAAETSGGMFEIRDGTKKVLDVLGFKKGDSLSGKGDAFTSETKMGALTTNTAISEVLAEKSMSFTYNGVTKSITFGTKDQLNNMNGEDFAKHMSEKLAGAFGDNRIKVSFNSSDPTNADAKKGSLTITTTLPNGDADPTSVIKMTNADLGILGETGVFGIAYGSSNKINKNATVEDSGLKNASKNGISQMKSVKIKGEDGERFDGYALSVNGKAVILRDTDTISDIMSKINSADAGVQISYNETSDTFNLKATDGGASGKIEIKDIQVDSTGELSTDAKGKYITRDGDVDQNIGNLAQKLFNDGTTEATYETISEKAGQDAQIEVDFDGVGIGADPVIITRGSNNFNLDGLNISVNQTFDSYKRDTNGNLTDKNGNIFKMDENGNKLDANGNKLDANGNVLLMDSDGFIVDASGNKLDKSGNPLAFNANGFVIDGSGNMIDKDGTTKLNAAGEKLDANGTVMKDNDGNPILGEPVKGFLGEPMKAEPVIDPDKYVKFNAQADADKIVEAVKSMAEDYNAMVDLINKEMTQKRNRDYPPLTDEQRADMKEDEIKVWEEKAKEGMLFNDTTLSALSTDLRFIFSSYTSEDIKSVGVSNSGTSGSNYENNGKITINEAELRTAIAERPDDVAKLFAGEMDKKVVDGKEQVDITTGGVMHRLKAVTDKYAATTGQTKGVLVERAGSPSAPTSLLKNTLQKSMDDIDKVISRLQSTLSTEQSRYYKQFTQLEQLIAKMNSQSSFLAEQAG